MNQPTRPRLFRLLSLLLPLLPLGAACAAGCPEAGTGCCPPTPPTTVEGPEVPEEPGDEDVELDVTTLGLSEEGQFALRLLLTTERFTDDAIGIAGMTPPEVKALRLLWQEPEANRAFHALMEHGTVAGNLFGLCGLYYTDPAEFAEQVPFYSNLRSSIEFQSGCIVDPNSPASQLVRSTGPNPVRLAGPDQRVKQWAKKHGGESYQLDIAGGGYPDVFRHGGGWYTVKHEPLVGDEIQMR